ncbi:hypothetical protein [Burkholderia cepacia]|uniref:hypothetical protein n=1 Tax=Burkholderia cepacia TaxID=292 RepID=UPI001CF10816|nr:hypothetical protein [Burkholderia cepacia]MCA8110285.1 hypothetical protein [Burkholderia cepacia]MCA8396584.1 hypothetical protein [Burkholderia cepacia]
MQITQEELKALASLIGKLDSEGILGDMGFVKKSTAQKQLTGFSKTFISVIQERFKKITNAEFTIGGEGYVSIHSISKVLGWDLADWKKLVQTAEAKFVYKRSVGGVIEHDGGATELTGSSPNGTVFVRAADIEALVLAARPRKGKTALAEFRNRNGLPV